MTLSQYLEKYLGNLASQLGYSDFEGSFDFIVSETLRYYGVATESQATDLNKLYAIGKVHLWKQILREVSFDYDISADGTSNKRSQIFDMATKNLNDCIEEANQYLSAYRIKAVKTSDKYDPYVYIPYDQRG
jgi:hypothetical protein